MTTIEQAPSVVRQLHHYLGRMGRVYAGFVSEDSGWSPWHTGFLNACGDWRVFSWSWTHVQTPVQPRGTTMTPYQDRPDLTGLVLAQTDLADGTFEFALEAPWMPCITWRTTSSSEENLRRVVQVAREIARHAHASWGDQ